MDKKGMWGSPATVNLIATVAYSDRTSRFIWSIWLNQTYRMNQINQTDKIDQTNQLSPHKHDRCKQNGQCK